MVAQFSSILSKANYNILDMINKSRNDIAYTLIDVDRDIDAALLDAIRAIHGVIRTREIPA